MKKLAVLLVITVVVIFNSCKEGITGPIEPEAGRRDYVWSVDTLGDTRTNQLWGMSYNDVYALDPEPYKYGKLWHFDGLNWINKPFYSPYQAQSFFGTSPTNIWFVSRFEHSIWLYNGIESKMHTDIKMEDFPEVIIIDMYGNAPWNVYGVGRAERHSPQSVTLGVIIHYDGLKWNYLDIPILEANFTNVYIDEYNGVIIQGYNRLSWTKTIWYYENNNIREIGSNDGSYNVAILKNGTIASSKKKVYSLDKGNLKEILDFNGIESSINGIWGRTTNDFFVIVNNGIAHYNGTDLKVIYPLSNTSVLDAIIFDKEVVFLVFDEVKRNTLIISGKLKE